MPDTRTEDVTVTLAREDWERLVRLADNAAQVSAQSVEDAEDYDPEEGPDADWIASRHERAEAGRAFSTRLRESVTHAQ
ncbi:MULTISPECIES: hypothetical protein [unclassified Frondihabitans]|jgi:hypothetical protein|uniref:hypothetical protein n=1 Tax=unclassified Frondihabitans TaxID=2626248 RepID=UPI000F4DDD31|nr:MULTISPECIES: hypothetical protein [unclassified Frondihabitans]RPE73737.1 hypothetical protein EDF37_3434 [Frondihabitans sp. PhB153]RPF02126.1 hypothetical protein EDF39_3447 [Frondihabitans sp. PhB161]